MPSELVEGVDQFAVLLWLIAALHQMPIWATAWTIVIRETVAIGIMLLSI